MTWTRRVLTALALVLLPLAAGSSFEVIGPHAPVAAAPTAQGGPGVAPPL